MPAGPQVRGGLAHGEHPAAVPPSEGVVPPTRGSTLCSPETSPRPRLARAQGGDAHG